MKKNKHIILHIGTIKTGTTSIQDSLGKAREALLEHQIYYPSIQPYAHITLAPIFVTDPETINWFQQKLQPFEDKNMKVLGYREDWLREFATCPKDYDFIISAETLSMPFFTEDAVLRLKEFIEPHFEKATILLYARHYNTWIASAFQQSVKSGFTTGDDIFEMSWKPQDYPALMSYRESLQKWVKAFGREAIVVRPFDHSKFHKNSLLADFIQACGLRADDITIPEVLSNESINENAIAFLQKYNQAYPVFINGAINLQRGLAREGLPLNLYGNLPGQKLKLEFIYTKEQAKKLNQEIDYINQFLKQDCQFQHVTVSDGEMHPPKAEDIPVKFFVELINNYNKKVENQQKAIASLSKQDENIRKQNELLLEQNIYFQKILDRLKIPFFLGIINKIPFLKTLLQKITNWNKA